MKTDAFPDGRRSVTYPDGWRVWYEGAQRPHRLDGPAGEYIADEDWYAANGKDAPARRWSNPRWAVRGTVIESDGGLLDELWDQGRVDVVTAVLALWEQGVELPVLVDAVLVSFDDA